MRIRWRGPRRPLLSIAVRSGTVTVAIVLAGCLLVWGVDLGGRLLHLGRTPARPDPEVQAAADRQAELARVQLARAQSAADAKTTHQQSIQIKSLLLENGRLQEDVAALARLLPGKESLIPRAEAELDASNRVHVSLLVAARADVPGSLDLLAAGERGGQPVALPFPLGEVHGARHVETVLALPDGVTLKSLAARLTDPGHARVVRVVTVKGCPSCSVAILKTK
jgi:hypothetical protein